MTRNICNRCQNNKFYSIRRGKKRCKNCGYEFKKRLGKLGLSREKWKGVIFWFMLEQSIRGIEEQTGVSHYSVSKAVKILRTLMIKDIPGIFSGTVKVDETYLGGQKKNKTKTQLLKDILTGAESKTGRGTTKQPVFGILARRGKVFARLVDDTGLAAKGYVHRTVEHGEKEYVRGKNHINGLEGFWGYLKRKLAAKGGVKRKYLPLFLGEYVWRYNYRKLGVKLQTDRLFKKVTDFSG